MRDYFMRHYSINFNDRSTFGHLLKCEVERILFEISDIKYAYYFWQGIQAAKIRGVTTAEGIKNKWLTHMQKKFNKGNDGGNIHRYFKRDFTKVLALDDRPLPITYSSISRAGMWGAQDKPPTIIIVGEEQPLLNPIARPFVPPTPRPKPSSALTIASPTSTSTFTQTDKFVEPPTPTLHQYTQMDIPIAQVVVDEATQTDMTKDTETHSWVDVNDMTLEQLVAKLEKMKYNISKIEKVLNDKLTEAEERVRVDRQNIDRLKELMTK
jgi:hypothetical protein